MPELILSFIPIFVTEFHTKIYLRARQSTAQDCYQDVLMVFLHNFFTFPYAFVVLISRNV